MKYLLIIFCFSIASSYGLAQCSSDAGPDYTITQSNDSIDQITLGGKTPTSGGSSNYSYLWSPTIGLSCATCPNPILTLSALNANTIFELKITDNTTKCVAKDEVVVNFNPVENKVFMILDQEGDDGSETFVVPEPTQKDIVPSDVHSYVDEDPKFPNGVKSLTEFIAKNLHYPETAIEYEIEGKCLVGMIINLDGSITDVRTLRGVSGCPECDREAERIVKLMPNFIPAKLQGKDVRSRYMIPVVFKLN